MAASLQERLYARAPVLLQHAAVSAFGFRWRRRRLGGRFAEERDGFVARESFTGEQWREWQTRALRQLLSDALREIPWYQQAYRGVLTLAQVERFTLQDLGALPLLEKASVREDPDRFLKTSADKRRLTICATSGTTGTPVRTYWSDEDFQRSLALREARGCLPAGVSYFQPRATFSGRLVVPSTQVGPPFHRFNVFERQVYFSAFHLAPQNVSAYLGALNRHHVVWGTGYSHAWEQLGRMMLEQHLPPPHAMRAIITTSEPLSEEGRAVVERAFGCRAYQEYGQVEEACWAIEDSARRIRVSPDAGLLEVLRPDGRPADAGESGEVVATGFIRRQQPLIRYRLGDLAALSPETAGGMPVLKEITGRLEDVVIGPDGQRTVRFHGIFTELPGCREAQVIQKVAGALVIRVVPTPHYSDATAAEIKARIAARFGPRMAVEVERVASIPRTRAGKYRAVVNLVTNPHQTY